MHLCIYSEVVGEEEDIAKCEWVDSELRFRERVRARKRKRKCTGVKFEKRFDDMTADFGKERDFSKVFASNLLFIPFPT